jgi:hypothetical protein
MMVPEKRGWKDEDGDGDGGDDEGGKGRGTLEEDGE